jgi:hypothetical protein
MKKFWKILGLGALAAGLTPYKVEKNAETGENSYQALLWRITSAPGENGDKRAIDINLGEGTLTSKLLTAAEKKNEPHLFSDDLSVEYAVPVVEDMAAAAEEVKENVAEAVEQAAEKAGEVVEEAVETVAEAAEEIADPEAPKAE